MNKVDLGKMAGIALINSITKTAEEI